jgi:hypothetical protein
MSIELNNHDHPDRDLTDAFTMLDERCGDCRLRFLATIAAYAISDIARSDRQHFRRELSKAITREVESWDRAQQNAARQEIVQ